METNESTKLNFYISLSKTLPTSIILDSVIIIIKMIPLFIITHDWNISSNKGISYWVRKFILCEFISYHMTYNIYPIITIFIFFTIVLTNLFTYIYYKHHQKNVLIKFHSFIVYYIYYAINQYIYSFFIEILFNNKNERFSNLLYYFLIVIIIINIIGIFYSNLILSTIIIHSPIFIKNPSYIINPLNEIDYIIPLLSIMQSIVQLEFYLNFKKMIIIKNIIRGLFCLFYIKEMFTFNKYYNRYLIEYIKRVFISTCFISCLIEWIFYYDYNNKLLILQNDIGIIILKLVIEINLSIVFTDIYFYIDNNIIQRRIENLSSKNIKTFDYNLVKVFNMIYFGDRPNDLKNILLILNKTLEKSIHHPKCKDTNCFYCYQYSFSEFNFQMDNYFEKEKMRSHSILNKDFPLLYNYFYNEISSFYDTFASGKRISFVPKLFIIISFFLLFERNYMKCLYLIEKINSIDNENKKSLYVYQNGILINKILSFHKNKGNEHRKIPLFNSHNDNIDRILKAENLIKYSLNSIKNIMNNYYFQK